MVIKQNIMTIITTTFITLYCLPCYQLINSSFLIQLLKINIYYQAFLQKYDGRAVLHQRQLGISSMVSHLSDNPIDSRALHVLTICLSMSMSYTLLPSLVQFSGLLAQNPMKLFKPSYNVDCQLGDTGRNYYVAGVEKGMDTA